MTLNKKLIVTCTLALLCTACVMNGKDDKGSKGNQGSKKGPPAEAFTACKSLSVGNACTVSTPRGEMTGSCRAAPRDNNGALACVPARGGKNAGGPSK